MPITARVKAPFRQHADGSTIYRLPWPGFDLFFRLERFYLAEFLYLFMGVFLFSFIYLMAKRKEVKVIHGHGLSCAVATVILSRIYRCKPIVSLHTIYRFSESPWLGWMAKRVLIFVDKILVLAKGCKEDLIAIGVPPERIVVYTNWIDLRIFSPIDGQECKRRLGLEADRFVALFVGRFTKEKGVELVLATASLAQEIMFILVGEGPMAELARLRARAQPNVRIVGWVRSEELPVYYNAADVLLWGSVDQDYLGRASMSALACGLPVIISNKTDYFGKMRPVSFAVQEIGFMLEPDPEIVAEKLRFLSQHRDLIYRKRVSCRNYALKNFSEKNAEAIIQSYFK